MIGWMLVLVGLYGIVRIVVILVAQAHERAHERRDHRDR